MGIVRGRYGETVSNVHRLDAGASGVVLCSKTKASLDFLSGQFQSKTVRKVQYAMVVLMPPPADGPSRDYVRDAGGALPPGFTVDLEIGPDSAHPGRSSNT